MRTLKNLAILFILIAPEFIYSQGRDSKWIMGYSSSLGRPYGGFDLDFLNGTSDTIYHPRLMNLATTSSSICDESGNLLFYSNGQWIANRNDAMMLNGDSLNPSFYTTWCGNYGLNLPQSNLIIPKPGDSLLYYMIHFTIDTFDVQTFYYANYLYYTLIDMSLDNGNGAVVSKNNVICDSALDDGGMAAVKHGNGRDWWILIHEFKDSNFVKFLITPDSIQGPFFQTIGAFRNSATPTGVFSKDGTKYAMFDGQYDLDVFDFDRCDGMLSNSRHSVINNNNYDGGCAFSEDGHFLYVTSMDILFQYDLSFSTLDSGKMQIAVWDSTYDPFGPPLATLFRICRLAPDNKIYISTGNGTRYLHVINHPDSLGLACDFQQHAITLPSINFNSIPYHPNYNLGPMRNSICDSLGLFNAVNHSPPGEKEISVFPNPTERVLYVSVGGHKHFTSMNIFNSLGTEVSCTGTSVKHDEYIEFNVSALLPGIYFIELGGEKERVVRRFVKL